MVIKSALLKVGALLQLALLWMVLTSSIAPEPYKFISVGNAETNSCAITQNTCGCATCGCSGGYTPGRPACPAGEVLYDDYCLPACPSGFRRYPGLPGLCVPPCQHGCPEGYDQIPLPQCPQGFHRDLRDPNYCLPDRDQQSDDQSCPYGMNYSPETGQCEVDCPSGTFLDEAGLCRSYYERECPKDYSRDPESGKCVPPGAWPQGYAWVCLPQCPEGTYRDVQKPTRCMPPPPTCPQGYENLQGRCLPVCEPGAKRDPYGYCTPPKDCEEGSYANLRGLCGQPECPQGTEQIRGQCVPQCDDGWKRNDNGRCEPPRQDCNDGEERVRGQCVPVCDQGLTRDQNGRCVPPRQDCNQGEEHFRGQCVPECKQGLTRDENGRCVPPRQDCPKGQRINIQTGDCERIPPVVKNCPKNMVYNERRNKCEPRQRECAEGTKLDKNGRCVGITPDCPDGTFLDKRGRCVPPRDEPQCGKGERLNDNGVCEPIVQRVPRGCPDGTYLDKRRKTCVPIRVDNGDNGDVRIDDTPERIPGVELIPDLLRQLTPQDSGDATRVPRQRSNDVAECPQGTFKDNNGRCMKLEKN